MALSGTKYFYALGQRTRARGLTKTQGEEFYCIDAAAPYARIAFDKGFRGLGL